MKKHFIFAIAGILSAICFTSYSFGDDEDLRLLSLRTCFSCDLSGLDLKGADLRYARLGDSNLTKTNLRGANLQKANLYGADLKWADLRDANLTEASIGGTTLFQVKLDGAIFCKTKTPWGEDNTGCK